MKTAGLRSSGCRLAVWRAGDGLDSCIGAAGGGSWSQAQAEQPGVMFR